jgi:hypothetical protein
VGAQVEAVEEEFARGVLVLAEAALVGFFECHVEIFTFYFELFGAAFGNDLNWNSHS